MLSLFCHCSLTSGVQAKCSAASQGVHLNAAAPAPAPPPLRHSKSLQVAHEAQPGALLLVDVLTATNVASINAPQDQQSGEGASDVQQMQQIVCGLTFEDTLNNTHTGNEVDLRSTYIYSFIPQPHPGAGDTCCHPLQVSSEDKQWW